MYSVVSNPIKCSLNLETDLLSDSFGIIPAVELVAALEPPVTWSSGRNPL
jgi:hypothetical protein